MSWSFPLSQLGVGIVVMVFEVCVGNGAPGTATHSEQYFFESAVNGIKIFRIMAGGCGRGCGGRAHHYAPGRHFAPSGGLCVGWHVSAFFWGKEAGFYEFMVHI